MLQLKYLNHTKKPLWLVESNYFVGTDAGCELCLQDHLLHEKHAQLNLKGDDATIENLIGDSAIRVNDMPVRSPKRIVHGDILSFGDVRVMLVDPKQPIVNNTAFNEASKPGWQLRPVNTMLVTKDIDVHGQMTLGRAPDCNISLPFSHLSRHHASLTVSSRGLEVRDLGSVNGTFVNGIKVDKAVLNLGDKLSFDSLAFTISGPERDVDKTVFRATLKTESAIPLVASQPDATRLANVGSKPIATPANATKRPISRMNGASGRESAKSTRESSHLVAPQSTPSKSIWPVIIVLTAAVGAAIWFYLNH